MNINDSIYYLKHSIFLQKRINLNYPTLHEIELSRWYLVNSINKLGK